MICHESNIKIDRYRRTRAKIVRELRHESNMKLLFSGMLISAPQPPQNLSVSNVTESSADLDWDAPSFGTWDDYKIYVRNVTDDQVEQEITGISLSEADVVGLDTGDEYEFWVVSVRDGIESNESNHVTANPVDVTAPDPPSNLTVVSSQNEQMDLSWDASPSGDVAGYNIYMDDGTGFTKHNSSLISGTTYTADNLTNGQSYDVKATAVDNWGNESGDSNIVTDTVTDTIAPSAPTGLQVDSFTDTTIDISWDANPEDDLAGYYVYVDGSKVNGGSLVTGGESHQITGLTQNTQYDIHITAEDTAGNESNSSSTVQQITQNVAPSAPTGVSATGGDTVIDVSWDANSEHDLEGYNVYVDGVKDNISLISGTTYQVTGLTNGQSYDVWVTATDNEYESDDSTHVSSTPEAPGAEYKIYRLRILSPSTTYPGTKEVGLMDVVGGNSIAPSSNGVVRSSGQFGSSNIPHPDDNAFDGDYVSDGEGWIGGSSPPVWVEYEFDTVTALTEYYVGSYVHDDLQSRAPQSWELLGSDDGINYEVIDSVSGETGWTAGEIRRFQL